MENREKLKNLLKNSHSLDEDEKKLLIGKIETLSDSDVLEAIETLELEQEKWEELRQDDEVSLQMFDQYIDESNEEIDKEYKKTLQEVEKRKSAEESDEAEKLIKSI